MNRTSKVLKRTLGLVVLMCMLPFGLHAQNITIKGTVSAADGPIIGATVKVKGAQGGVVTDFDGNYSISAQSNATLVFSYVGYVTKEVKVGGKRLIDVILEEDETLLNEVVVVGYGTMRKSDLTGAVTQVDNKAFEKSVSTSIDQVLQGSCCWCPDTGKHRYARWFKYHPYPWYQLSERLLTAYLRH